MCCDGAVYWFTCALFIMRVVFISLLTCACVACFRFVLPHDVAERHSVAAGGYSYLVDGMRCVYAYVCVCICICVLTC